MAHSIRLWDADGSGGGGYTGHWTCHIDPISGSYSEIDIPVADPADPTRFYIFYVFSFSGLPITAGFDFDSAGPVGDLRGGTTTGDPADWPSLHAFGYPPFTELGFSVGVDPASDPDWWHSPPPVLPPVLTAVSPDFGVPGDSVILTGSALSTVIHVDFNLGFTAAFTIIDDNHIRAIVPSGAGVRAVTVTSPGTSGPQTSGPQTFTYVAPPDILSTLPTPTARGCAVRMFGNNLQWTTSVTFGDIPADWYFNGPASSLIVQIPLAAAAGIGVGITVTNAAGSRETGLDIYDLPGGSSYLSAVELQGFDGTDLLVTGFTSGGDLAVIASLDLPARLIVFGDKGNPFIGATAVDYGHSASSIVNASVAIVPFHSLGGGTVTGLPTATAVPGGGFVFGLGFFDGTASVGVEMRFCDDSLTTLAPAVAGQQMFDLGGTQPILIALSDTRLLVFAGTNVDVANAALYPFTLAGAAGPALSTAVVVVDPSVSPTTEVVVAGWQVSATSCLIARADCTLQLVDITGDVITFGTPVSYAAVGSALGVFWPDGAGGLWGIVPGGYLDRWNSSVTRTRHDLLPAPADESTLVCRELFAAAGAESDTAYHAPPTGPDPVLIVLGPSLAEAWLIDPTALTVSPRVTLPRTSGGRDWPPGGVCARDDGRLTVLHPRGILASIDVVTLVLACTGYVRQASASMAGVRLWKDRG